MESAGKLADAHKALIVAISAQLIVDRRSMRNPSLRISRAVAPHTDHHEGTKLHEEHSF